MTLIPAREHLPTQVPSNMRPGLLPQRSDTVTVPNNNPDQTLDILPLLRGEIRGPRRVRVTAKVAGTRAQAPGHAARCSSMPHSWREGVYRSLRAGLLGPRQTAGLQPRAATTGREIATTEPWLAGRY